MKYILFLILKSGVFVLFDFLYYLIHKGNLAKIRIERDNATSNYTDYYKMRIFKMKLALYSIVFFNLIFTIDSLSEAIQLYMNL